ncbi:MAG: hypothetical protein IKA44_02445 [Clostridia bacterium]|nr:hypothetical protein [Clostridia bacterium]
MKKRQQKSQYSVSIPSRLCLVFGLFAILCQLCFLYLWISIESPTVSADVLAHTFAPLLEYPLMSLTLLLGGTLLIEYILRKL